MSTQTAQASGAALATTVTEDAAFADLLAKEFKPRTDEQRSAVESAVRTLAEQALESSLSFSGDAYRSIEAIIGEIDRKLSEQIDHIVHHADFQQLESAWRGLHYLVNNTESDEMLKIRVMNLSKKELHRTLRRHKGVGWDQSPLFRRIYEEEYGQLGGAPYACLVGDYYFDHSAPDVELLGEMAKIGAAAHCPFIAGAAPDIMQMNSWQELANPRDLTKIFENTEYAPWRSLRDSDDSRYIGLAMPRFLGRLPYGAQTNPVDDFDFEESTNGADHQRYLWVNAAYAMAVNVNRSFKYYGWATSIRGVESGGVVEGLPCHTFPTDDGGLDMKCPTEIAISDRREAELAKNGFMPLIHRKNTDAAAFIGAQSLQSTMTLTPAPTPNWPHGYLICLPAAVLHIISSALYATRLAVLKNGRTLNAGSTSGSCITWMAILAIPARTPRRASHWLPPKSSLKKTQKTPATIRPNFSCARIIS